MSQPQQGQRRAPEATAAEERRPIVGGQHNGSTPHAPGDPGTELVNYNTMTQETP